MPDEAAREGPSQVAGALFASTITSVAIFLPILFMKGLEGQLFADLALTLAVAVTTSLIAAMTVLPVASNYFRSDQMTADRLGEFWDRMTNKIVALTSTPQLRTKWIAGLLLVPALLTYLLAPKLDFLPQANSDGVEVYFSMPEGIPLSTIENELILEVIDRLQPYVDVAPAGNADVQ